MENSEPIDKIFTCTLCDNGIFNKFESLQYHVAQFHNIHTRDALNYCHIYSKDTQVINIPVRTKGTLSKLVNAVERLTRPRKKIK